MITQRNLQLSSAKPLQEGATKALGTIGNEPTYGSGDGRGADTAPDLARRSKVPQYATKQLVEWFAAETERRYISQNGLLNQMKLIYLPRADFITTTWLQNFCRNKPQMSGI